MPSSSSSKNQHQRSQQNPSLSPYQPHPSSSSSSRGPPSIASSPLSPPSSSSRPVLTHDGRLFPSKLSPLDALASQTKKLSIKRNQHPPPLNNIGAFNDSLHPNERSNLSPEPSLNDNHNFLQILHQTNFRHAPSHAAEPLSPSFMAFNHPADDANYRQSSYSIGTNDSDSIWNYARSNEHDEEDEENDHNDSGLRPEEDETDPDGGLFRRSTLGKPRPAGRGNEPDHRSSSSSTTTTSFSPNTVTAAITNTNTLTNGVLMTGSVQRNQPVSQIREHITSFYGDQQVIPPSGDSYQSLPANHSGIDRSQSNRSFANHSHSKNGPRWAQGSHRNGGEEAEEWEEEEVLGQQLDENEPADHNRLTYLTNVTSHTDFESDGEDSTTKYASGHSISSEDPFQYWHYETPRQVIDQNVQSINHSNQQPSSFDPSRDPTNYSRNNQAQPASSSQPQETSAVESLQPNIAQYRRPRNFSRPLKPVSVSEDHLPTPPQSREVSPRDSKSVEDSGSKAHWNSHYSHSTLGPGLPLLQAQQQQISHELRRAPSPSTESLYSLRNDSPALGRYSISPAPSRRSVDSMSSNGTKKSWKDIFRKRNGRESVSYDDFDNTHSSTHLVSSASPSALPSITFYSADPSQAGNVQESWTKSLVEDNQSTEIVRSGHSGSAVQASDAVQIQFQPSNNHRPSQKNLDPNAPSINTTYFPQPAAMEGRLGQNGGSSKEKGPQNSHRLSIYSLDDSISPSQVFDPASQKTRYMSRSPVSVSSFHANSPSSSQPATSGFNQSNQSRNNQAKYSSNLPPAMAKTKASLSFNLQSDQLNSSSMGMTRSNSKAHEFLQLGIEAHESGDLEKSAGLFERAARENGGCGAGMLMWGLSLRHGWGCQVNETRAFKWLQKAAESVVDNLDVNVSKQADKKRKEETVAAKTELVLAIYELGQCFMRGWGCKKDKKLAINYFELAAKLGDPDAQQELGFCFANGVGTKKDLKKSAKYYRMAANQGIEMMGSQWIWKEKYDEKDA